MFYFVTHHFPCCIYFTSLNPSLLDFLHGKLICESKLVDGITCDCWFVVLVNSKPDISAPASTFFEVISLFAVILASVSCLHIIQTSIPAILEC